MSDKYGFVYIWYNKVRKMYYIGSHWGTENDGYVCSSNWMRNDYNRHKENFKRKIIKRVYSDKIELHIEEEKYLQMMKISEMKPLNDTPRYYNLTRSVKDLWHKYPEHIKTVGQKISLAKTGKNTGPRDPSVGEAISKAKKGKFSDKQKAALEALAIKNTGSTHTKERKKVTSDRLKKEWKNGLRKGKPWSEEQKNIMKDSKQKQGDRLAQNFIITDPEGKEFEIRNLSKWCKDHNMFASNFCKVLKGTSEHYKGYKIKRLYSGSV